MRTTQILKQSGLVLIGQGVTGPRLADTGLGQLLEQGHHRHLEFNSKLRNGCCGHSYLPLTRTSEHVPSE